MSAAARRDNRKLAAMAGGRNCTLGVRGRLAAAGLVVAVGVGVAAVSGAAAGASSAANGLVYGGGTMYRSSYTQFDPENGAFENRFAGAITGTPKVYLVFLGDWGTQGTDANGNLTFSNDPLGAAPYVQNFLKGLGTNGEKWSSVMGQYCSLEDYSTRGTTACPEGADHVGVPTNGVLAGVWNDNVNDISPWQRGYLTETTFAAEHFTNNDMEAPVDAQFIVMTPPGVNESFPARDICSQHDGQGTLVFRDDGQDNREYPTSYIRYQSDSAQCGGGLDAFSIAVSRVYAAAMTDPSVAAVYGDLIYVSKDRPDHIVRDASIARPNCARAGCPRIRRSTCGAACLRRWARSIPPRCVLQPIMTGCCGCCSPGTGSPTSRRCRCACGRAALATGAWVTSCASLRRTLPYCVGMASRTRRQRRRSWQRIFARFRSWYGATEPKLRSIGEHRV